MSSYLQQILVLLFSVEVSSHSHVTAQSVDGELFSRIVGETITDIRILADVQVAAGDTYDESADLRVLRHVDAEQSREMWWIIVLI